MNEASELFATPAIEVPLDIVSITTTLNETAALTKKDKLYSLGIGYGTNKQISLQGGIFWKIKL